MYPVQPKWHSQVSKVVVALCRACIRHAVTGISTQPLRETQAHSCAGDARSFEEVAPVIYSSFECWFTERCFQFLGIVAP